MVTTAARSEKRNEQHDRIGKERIDARGSAVEDKAVPPELRKSRVCVDMNNKRASGFSAA